MKAIVFSKYGSPDNLELKEVARPNPKPHEVLVRVQATSLNAGDLFMLLGTPWIVRLSVGFPQPDAFILGWDMAGIVEAVGAEVTSFQPGNAVYAAGNRALAEYVTVSEDKLALKPTTLTFVEAAAVPTAGITALQGLRDAGGLQAGQSVLINGASGGVGSFAVQIAKAMGTKVTGVCSTRNLALVRSLGADKVIDYTQEDFTQGADRYDLILDNVSSHKFSELRRVLTPHGMIIPNSGFGGMGYIVRAFLLSPFMPQLDKPLETKMNGHDLAYLTALIDAGMLRTVVDQTYPLAESAAAFRYLLEKHAQGKVVITVAENGR